MFWKENENRGETSKLSSASKGEHTTVTLIHKKLVLNLLLLWRKEVGVGGERKTQTQRHTEKRYLFVVPLIYASTG